MTTLLEYILTEYLGQPISTRGNGESYWPCPVCSHSKFHSMPVHPTFKHRAKCHRCGFMEDAPGLLREFHSGAYEQHAPLPNYNDRIELIENLKLAWKLHQKLEQRRGRGVSKLRATKKKAVKKKGSKKKVVKKC